MMMNIQTQDRFDDPKGKTIQVAAQEWFIYNVASGIINDKDRFQRDTYIFYIFHIKKLEHAVK